MCWIWVLCLFLDTFYGCQVFIMKNVIKLFLSASLLLASPCYTMMQGEKTSLHNIQCLFVINNIVFNVGLIILLDLSTQAKIQLAVFCEEPLWLLCYIMLFYRWWHPMKGIFLTHVVRMQYLNWRACMDGDVCTLNCDDFTKVIVCVTKGYTIGS